ncbi:hypothetical protein [Phytohabitans kaempferiae]|uniref:Secreted protein n=1 Tax=Phytohabitans kaempferiae TaxID=1620943 RepID=A0ABV6M5S3_9ACTN
MTYQTRHLIRKALVAVGLAAALTAGGLTNAGPALAQEAPVSSAPVEPLVTGCNGTMPSGWQLRAVYSYCSECKVAGQFWEATGSFRAHCQTFGNGARLWTFCVACRGEEEAADWRPVWSATPVRLAVPA